MYVLCTLVLLTLQNLLKRLELGEPGANEGPEQSSDEAVQPGQGQRAKPPWHGGSAPTQGGISQSPYGCVIHHCSESHQHEQRSESPHYGKGNVPTSSKKVQPVQRSASLGPAVMFGTRKTWDIGHAPCLQDLWKKDVSLDASSVDFLMSDGEEDTSFLPLQPSVFPRHRLSSDLSETHSTDNQQLLIQTLQERVCEFQARLRGEEAGKRLQLQQGGHQAHSLSREHRGLVSPDLKQTQDLRDQHRLQDYHQIRTEATNTGGRSPCSVSQRLAQSLSLSPDARGPLERDLKGLEGEQLVLLKGLHTQIEELEEKLLDQTQEVERLRSELGATDLEKQLEVLESENQRLKQELKAGQAQASPSTCSNCPHSQDVERLRDELCRREEECLQRERRLAGLELQVRERTGLVTQLEQQLEEATRRQRDLQLWLDEATSHGRDTKEQLTSKLRECEQALTRQAAMPPQVKYVTKTVEVESAQCKQALAECQARNLSLQEQLSVQRQLLRELENHLHESQKTSGQLRQQLRADRGRLCGLLSKAVGWHNSDVIHRLSKILVYEGEMERAQGQLEAEMQSLEEEKNRVIEDAFIRAESEMKAVHENLAGVRMNLLTLQPALRTLTCDYNCLKRQVQDFPFLLDKAIAEAKQEICQVIGEVSSANQELLRKYKREMNLRKKCHNELVRLKGNIRVFCRVRPVSQNEMDSVDAKNMVTFDSDDDSILYLSNKGKPMTFDLDKVFPPHATQEEVFQEVQSLVTSCIDGFNVCIFAYGQTGSGKTYTMEGISEDPGINQRALRLLFAEVSEKKPDWDYNISVSMVEIYNETLRDLLGENLNDKLEIKMCPDGSGQLYVPGLTVQAVKSVEDINKVLELGHMNRATACTNLNDHSSRSHALLIVTVAGFNSSTGHRTTGKLNLVDLAGSERITKSGAEGSRLREAQCINKSLSALGDVINALRSRQSHVPFRNSRLTYLLQDSLSGDSKTLMMVQVSPLDTNVSESVCSLKFAQRVRNVELGYSSRKQTENSSTSSSPTHDSVELDSPPVTPVPLPISRASSAGSTLSSTSKTPSTRRRSHSQLATDRQVDRRSPLVGDGGQDE
ncbi:kinesin-like protein KIFC3 isoform X3 [Clupea harengus]|uniref:Kinesin-like protein KIFC3 n=1 Tax=Clupea harengus TaxID=7950 RepID=A0A6P8FA19_CLUHA|nr:kinesin-like protein KIFC3 isoform X3 [Clupea harengus]